MYFFYIHQDEHLVGKVTEVGNDMLRVTVYAMDNANVWSQVMLGNEMYSVIIPKHCVPIEPPLTKSG